MGSFLGSVLSISIEASSLKIIIGISYLLIALQTLFNSSLVIRNVKPSFNTVLYGAGTGAASSILGIGGGTFSVPYFKASGLNLTSAIGTSAACGVPIAIFGTLGYIIAGINKDMLPAMSLGYIYLPALIGVSITSIFSAKYGADIAHYLSQSVLRKLMAAWFFIVSIYMFLI